MSNPMLFFEIKPAEIVADWGARSNAIKVDGGYLLPYEWAKFYNVDDYEVILITDEE